MLINALALCCTLMLLSTTVAQVAVLEARSAANRPASSLLDAGFAHAVAAFQGAVSAGAQLDPGTGDYTLPSFALGEHLIAQPLWLGGYRLNAEVTVAGVQGRANGGPDLAPNSQHADKLAEERLSLRVDTAVIAQNSGAIEARRSAFVTLRLFGQRPFSTIAGQLFGDAADPAGLDSSAHEGDSGGHTFPIENGEIAPGDTGLHLIFKCFGNVNNCQFSNPPVDRGHGGSGFGEVHWTANNQNATHWAY